MRRAILLMLVVILAGCGSESLEEWTQGPAPLCVTTNPGRLLLMAQSAPDAVLIPCIEDLPRGWEYVRARTSTSLGEIAFTNNTFDLGAEVVLTPSCDVSGARRADSPRPGTQLFIEDTTISFTFEGGCIQFVYETSQLAESDAGQGLIDGVQFMTRDALREFADMTL